MILHGAGKPPSFCYVKLVLLLKILFLKSAKLVNEFV